MSGSGGGGGGGSSSSSSSSSNSSGQIAGFRGQWIDTTHNASHRHKQHFVALQPPTADDVGSHRPPGGHQRNKTSATAASTAAAVIRAVDSLKLAADGGVGAMTSRNESFYSAAAILTIAGIFVALTMTASLALFVFWRKTNTVFALQKCEQEDYADEFDYSNDGTVADDDYDADETRATESDSDGDVPHVVISKLASNRSLSRNRPDRWLPVESDDADCAPSDAVTLSRGRFSRKRSKSGTKRAQSDATLCTSTNRDDMLTMTCLTPSDAGDVIGTQCVEHFDEDSGSQTTINSIQSSTVVETRFSFR